MTDLEIIKAPEQPKLRRIAGLPEAWAIFVRLRGDITPNTHEHYRFIANKFLPYMADKALEPQVIMEWVLHLQDLRGHNRKGETRLSGRTINAINARIKPFLKWLKTMEYTPRDLSDCIQHLPELPRKESITFTEEEYEAVKKWCTGRAWCQPHLWFFILGYRTGLSLVDCCHLRWGDPENGGPGVYINHNGHSYIDVYRIKIKRLGGKALCQIPLIPFSDVYNWLVHLRKQEHRHYQRHDGISNYVHWDGPGLYVCGFQNLDFDFKKIFRAVGIPPGKTFRHLRNSFCSNLVNSNTNIALVCKMTGHSNPKTLMHYVKPDRRALQDGLQRAFTIASEQSGIGKGHSGIVTTEDIEHEQTDDEATRDQAAGHQVAGAGVNAAIEGTNPS